MRRWCTLLTCAAALMHPQPKAPASLKAPAPLKAADPLKTADPLSPDELTKLRFEAAATDPLARLRLAIITHAQVYNSTDVDEDFVVPETWPQPLRGLELGAAVASLRRLEASAAADRRRHKSRTHKYSGEELRRDASSPRPSRTGWGRKLTQAGFDWAPRYVDGKHFAQIIKALKAYEDEHADLLLPRSFRVPAREPYPAALAGVDLDRAVYDLSFYRTFLAGRPERQQILRELGFCWGRLQPEFNLVIEALITFREWEGHLLVPAAFEVPRDDARWPASTRGMPLGRRVRQIRRRNDYLGNDAARWRSLDELGFCWEPKKTKRSVAARALRRYEELQLNPAAPPRGLRGAPHEARGRLDPGGGAADLRHRGGRPALPARVPRPRPGRARRRVPAAPREVAGGRLRGLLCGIGAVRGRGRQRGRAAALRDRGGLPAGHARRPGAEPRPVLGGARHPTVLGPAAAPGPARLRLG